jgi:hypothetical protein
MLNADTIVGIVRPWPEAQPLIVDEPDGLLVGVDNNRARLDTAATG